MRLPARVCPFTIQGMMCSFLAPLADPLAMFWAGMSVLTAYRLGKRQWRRALWPGLLALTIYLFAGTSLPVRLLASLERPYAGRPLDQLPEADAVLMLGGTLTPSAYGLFGFDASPTFDRVLTVAEVLRRGKAKVAVLGGGGPPPDRAGPEESRLLERWLSVWGLTNAMLLPLPACRDTHDEALHLRRLAQTNQWRNLIVVSSAWHLRRAEGLFRQLEVPVTAFGCDFRGLTALEQPRPFSPFPSSLNLLALNEYMHEEIGWWVYRWRGWVR